MHPILEKSRDQMIEDLRSDYGRNLAVLVASSIKSGDRFCSEYAVFYSALKEVFSAEELVDFFYLWLEKDKLPQVNIPLQTKSPMKYVVIEMLQGFYLRGKEGDIPHGEILWDFLDELSACGANECTVAETCKGMLDPLNLVSGGGKLEINHGLRQVVVSGSSTYFGPPDIGVVKNLLKHFVCENLNGYSIECKSE